MRFLHTSDWQLGMTRHFLEGEAQARYSAARIDAIRSLGDVARREACEFVVVAGDVFESNMVAERTVRRALDALAGVPCPVYLLPGNHDPLDAASVYRSAVFRQAQPGNVVVLQEPGVLRVRDGVELVAAPWFTKRPLEDLVGDAVAGLAADGTVRVVVGHGAVDALSPDADDPAVIRLARLAEALAAGTVHYVALGDRHSRLPVGGTGRVRYSGSPEVTAFVEDLPGDVLVVELDDEVEGGCTVTPHHVGSWRFVDLVRDVNGTSDVDAVDAELAAMTGKDRTVVRTALTGTLGLADKARLDAVLDRHRETFAALYAWERHEDIAVVVDDGELIDLGVGGFVAAAVGDLAEVAAEGGDGAQDARDALSLLYRLVSGGAR
ncbi:MAG: exonuclease SbcCD subunit D [Actinobacteria bacterium]|nr:exonuclease SbcCD subunit D [Actinomycetota bacterium]